jgi:excisionase family DNA binding protein
MKLLTVEDISECLQISQTYVYQLINSKKLPAIKIGGVWRVKELVFERWIDELEDGFDADVSDDLEEEDDDEEEIEDDDDDLEEEEEDDPDEDDPITPVNDVLLKEIEENRKEIERRKKLLLAQANYYTTNEVSIMAGVARTTVNYNITKGNIKPLMVGGRYIIPAEEVQKYLKNRKAWCLGNEYLKITPNELEDNVEEYKKTDGYKIKSRPSVDHFTLNESAVLVGKPYATLYHYVKKGEIKTWRRGKGRYWVPLKELKKIVARMW